MRGMSPVHAAGVGLGLALALGPGPPAQAESMPNGDPMWEGAIGLVAHRGASYAGSSDFSTSLRPGGFIRWGRYTLTGAGGFTTRRQTEVERGFGAEVLRRENLRVSLNLRLDGGRSQADSPQLAGMGNVPSTLRARLGANWDAAPGWRVTGSVSADVLNRVGGLVADAGVSHQWDFGHGRLLTAGAGLSVADGGYMQAWHGVTSEQSLRSGYPVYEAGGGLRGVSTSLTYRHEFGPALSGYVGVDASRLLGSPARSPLTRQPLAAGASAGLAWRF
jgi:outer membrane protein